MTLLAVCDVCGQQRQYEADEELQPLPDGWITVDTEGQAVHFCSWLCCGTFVTQQIRSEEVEKAGSYGEPGPATTD